MLSFGCSDEGREGIIHNTARGEAGSYYYAARPVLKISSRSKYERTYARTEQSSWLVGGSKRLIIVYILVL